MDSFFYNICRLYLLRELRCSNEAFRRQEVVHAHDTTESIHDTYQQKKSTFDIVGGLLPVYAHVLANSYFPSPLEPVL